MFRRLSVLLTAGVLLATVMTSLADANVISKTDGNDTKGPLDLAGMKVSHVPGGSVFQIKTLAPFTNKEANGNNGFFQVGLDTNADQHPNYYIDVFFAAGRFRGVLFKPNGTVITYYLKAARVSSKAVKVTLPHAKIVQKGSYDFVIFSIYFGSPCTKKRPCVDGIPNRYPLIRHDFTAPTVTWGVVPAYSTDGSTDLTEAVPFSVIDDVYGSGVKSWSLQSRVAGSSIWIVRKTGTSLSPAPHLTGAQGTTYDYRIVAVDRQKNKTTSSTVRTSFPYDDRNLLFTYSASTQQDAVVDAFLGTTSTVAMNETISFSMPGDASDVCIVRQPTTGATATVSFSEGGTIDETGATAVRSVQCLNLGSAVPDGTAVSFTVTTAEPFVVDGIVVLP